MTLANRIFDNAYRIPEARANEAANG